MGIKLIALFLLLFLFLYHKLSKKKIKIQTLLSWLHPLMIQLMMVRIKVFSQVRKWSASFVKPDISDLCQRRCGVKKKSEPGPLQNAAHLCFRLQAMSRSALTLVARPARRFSFPRLPGCKQFAMNSFKTVGRNNNNPLFIYGIFFFLLSRTIKGGRDLKRLVMLMNVNSKNQHTDSQSKRA